MKAVIQFASRYLPFAFHVTHVKGILSECLWSENTFDSLFDFTKQSEVGKGFQQFTHFKIAEKRLRFKLFCLRVVKSLNKLENPNPCIQYQMTC